MGKELQIKMEVAKSWFSLAQITITLAGFLFLLVGVFYSSSQMIDMQGLVITNNKLDTFQKNNMTIAQTSSLIQKLIEPIEEKKENNWIPATISLIGGIMATIISFVFWKMGKNKFSRKRKPQLKIKNSEKISNPKT